jgi:hypothetical protein
MIKTDHITEHKTPNTAAEFDDYCPILQKITFIHSETEVRVSIQLVNKDLPELVEKDNEGEESPEEETDVMF